MKYLSVVLVVMLGSTVANADWRVVASDQLREKTFAVSNWAFSEENSDYPGPLKAVAGVGCESDGEQWVYIKLSQSVSDIGNPTRAIAVNGQLSWQGNTSYSAPFNYYPSARVLFLQAGVDDAISLMRGSSNLALEINWADTRSNTFSFELSGSKTAIDAALARCANAET